MKRSWLSLIIFSLLIFPCMGLLLIIGDGPAMAGASSFYDLHQELKELYSQDTFQHIEVKKNISLNTFTKTLSVNVNDYSDSTSLSFDKVRNICNDNDYVVIEEENGYEIYDRFSAKRLLIVGQPENSYGASNIIKGLPEFDIYCYNSTEKTKEAYYNLIQDDSLQVMVDSLITSEDFEIVEANETYNSWGAKAMDLDVYTDYLKLSGSERQIVVAVLDTGINTAHEIFTNRLLNENGKIVGYSYYETQYKYSGYSFEDDKGHGTHVSGIVCDLTPSNVKILPIKVLNNEGKGYLSTTITALNLIISDYADKYEVVCANMSLGGELESDYLLEYYNNAFSQVFNSLKEKNILSVVSAGNDRANTRYYAPALCEESAIVVSALKESDSGYEFDSSYSNYGNSVDICAPGTFILSAWIGPTDIKNSGAWVFATGTSMAAPHVSAAVALLTLDGVYIKDGTPTFTADEIEKRLFGCAVDMGSEGEDVYYGHGMLNLKNYDDVLISFTVEDCEVTYDGQYHNISVSVLEQEDYTITYGLTKNTFNITDWTSNSAFKNATSGKTVVYFQITAPDCYTTTGKGYLNIKPINLTIKTQDQTFTYGNVSLNQSKYSILTGRVINNESVGIVLKSSATSRSSVGSYMIFAQCSNKNYSVTTSNHGNAIITKRDILIKLQNQTFTYGDEISLNTTSYSVLSGVVVNNDNLGLKLATNATSLSEAGQYELFLSDYTNKNYNLTCLASKLIISVRNIKISLNTQSSMYFEDISLNLNDYSITEGKVVNNDDLGLSLTTDANKMLVGSYTISYGGSSNTNYNVECQDGVYNVEKRQITVTVENQEFLYGGNFNFDSTKFAITDGSIVNNDNLNFHISTTATATSEVGKYPIILTFENPNYDVDIIPGKVIIKERMVNISIPAQIIVYGEEVSLENLEYQVVSADLIGADKLEITFSTSATSTSDVGTYEIIAINANSNYEIVLDNKDFVITKRKLVLETSQTSVYGENIVLDNNNYQIIEGEIVNNDNLGIKFTTSAAKRSGVGTYDIYSTHSNQNYELTFSKNEYIITQRTLTLTLGNQQGTYGDVVNLNQKSYTIVSGLVADDNAQITLSTEATNYSGVGQYKVFVHVGNKNYKVESNGGEYRIFKRPVTIRLKNQLIPFSFNIKLDNTAYDVILGSIVNNDDLQLSVFSNVNSYSLSGYYTLNAISENQNYDVKVIGANLEIEFSGISFAIIFVPLVAFSGVGITIYLVLRRMKKKHLENYF